MIYKIWRLIATTFLIWDESNSSRMSAAMTYYTMLSLTPLLVIAVAIAGYIYDDQVAIQEIVDQVSVATSPAIAKTVSGLIQNATRPNSGLLASSISLLVLFYAASGVFSQLYDTFNDIWRIPQESRTGIKFTVQKRLVGVGMVLTAGVLLIGTLTLGSVIAYLNHLFHDAYPEVIPWLNLADRGLSFLLMPFIFALIFWFFPATKIKWEDVWPAGILTASLIAANRYLIAIYLKFSTTSEVYGAAGSVVVMLIWIYMTGLMVFFGASFSHAWALVFGSRSDETPTPNQGPLGATAEESTSPPASAFLSTPQLKSAPESSAATVVTPPTPSQPEQEPPLVLSRRDPGEDSDQ